MDNGLFNLVSYILPDRHRRYDLSEEKLVEVRDFAEFLQQKPKSA